MDESSMRVAPSLGPRLFPCKKASYGSCYPKALAGSALPFNLQRSRLNIISSCCGGGLQKAEAPSVAGGAPSECGSARDRGKPSRQCWGRGRRRRRGKRGAERIRGGEYSYTVGQKIKCGTGSRRAPAGAGGPKIIKSFRRRQRAGGRAGRGRGGRARPNADAPTAGTSCWAQSGAAWRVVGCSPRLLVAAARGGRQQEAPPLALRCPASVRPTARLPAAKAAARAAARGA